MSLSRISTSGLFCAMWKVDGGMILAALVLDFVLGDPRRFPHITRITGGWIRFAEKGFRSLRTDGICGGCAFTLVVIAGILGPTTLLYTWLQHLHPVAAWSLDCLILFQSIAFRDLIRHVKAVEAPLLKKDLEQARNRLSWIVGRDTGHLDSNEISRASIEALAESIHDGFVGPLFWAFLLGPFGALLFRIANTLDSMVGHRDERYERFGKCSARLDDAMGLLSSRLSGLILWIARPSRSIQTIIRDARKHASPNAGWPEATMAYGLGLRLGGNNCYDGVPIDGPIFNSDGKSPAPHDIHRALKVSFVAWLLVLCIGLAVFATQVAIPG